MSGISKIVDERIERLRKEKSELDALRAELAQREAALVRREAAPIVTPAPAAPVAVAPKDIKPLPQRGRGRPRKGEEATPVIPSQGDLVRMRAALFAELADLETQKLAILTEINDKKAAYAQQIAQLEEEKAARQIEANNAVARIKLKRMTELERELEAYREECFANLQNELERQRKLNTLRLKDTPPKTPKQAPPPLPVETPPVEPPPLEPPKKKRGRPRKAV